MSVWILVLIAALSGSNLVERLSAGRCDNENVPHGVSGADWSVVAVAAPPECDRLWEAAETAAAVNSEYMYDCCDQTIENTSAPGMRRQNRVVAAHI